MWSLFHGPSAQLRVVDSGFSLGSSPRLTEGEWRGTFSELSSGCKRTARNKEPETDGTLLFIYLKKLAAKTERHTFTAQNLLKGLGVIQNVKNHHHHHLLLFPFVPVNNVKYYRKVCYYYSHPFLFIHKKIYKLRQIKFIYIFLYIYIYMCIFFYIYLFKRYVCI